MIAGLWRDPDVQWADELMDGMGFRDHCRHFLDHVVEISHDDWVPTAEDLLRLPRRSYREEYHPSPTGAPNSLSMTIGGRIVELIDLPADWYGWRPWRVTRILHNVGLAMFVVSLTDFDGEPFEDSARGRTAEAIDLFQQFLSTPALSRTPFFLVFNESEHFERKIKGKAERFLRAYPEFEGDVTRARALQHIRQRYLMLCQGRTPWVAHADACALDAASVRRLWEEVASRVTS
jgi:hypothetical protein